MNLKIGLNIFLKIDQKCPFSRGKNIKKDIKTENFFLVKLKVVKKSKIVDYCRIIKLSKKNPHAYIYLLDQHTFCVSDKSN